MITARIPRRHMEKDFNDFCEEFDRATLLYIVHYDACTSRPCHLCADYIAWIRRIEQGIKESSYIPER